MTQLSRGDVAVVTGAARGIGLALAHAFASRGLRVAIADIDADAVEVARAELASTGAEVLALPTDVSDEAAVFALAEATIERFGSVDVVCNNAGTANYYTPCWEIPADSWKRLIDVNVWSVVHGIRAFVPHLVAKNSGHVLNTASMSGLKRGSALNGDYALSKHAVVGVTESLSEDFAKFAPGVKATVLCPGFVRTPLAARQAGRLEEAITAQGATAPQWGAPLEPSAAAALALRAIESDLLYAVPSQNPENVIRDRFDRLMHDIEEQSRWRMDSAPPAALT